MFQMFTAAQPKNRDPDKRIRSSPIGGRCNFEDIEEKELYFVDKTKLISHIFNRPANVISITRPSHFGKSSALSMLQYFLDSEKHNKLKMQLQYDPFSNYSINHNTQCNEKHKGKYTVIDLNFLSLVRDNYEKFLYSTRSLLRDIYIKFSHIKKQLKNEEAEFYSNVCRSSIEIEEGSDFFSNALQRLCIFITHYNETLDDKTKHTKPIILIDEFDAPFLNASQCGYFNQMCEIMSRILSSTELHNKESVAAKIVFVGVSDAIEIMRQRSDFTLSNVQICSLEQDDLSDCFGVTENEIKIILAKRNFKVEEEYPKLLEQYGYYYCGNQMLFNPHSIGEAIKENTIDFGGHWIKSQRDSYIKTVIEATSTSSRNFHEQLVKKHFITSATDKIISYLPPAYELKIAYDEPKPKTRHALIIKDKTCYYRYENFSKQITQEDYSEIFLLLDKARLLNENKKRNLQFINLDQGFKAKILDVLVEKPPLTIKNLTGFDEKIWLCSFLYVAGFLTVIPSKAKIKTLIIPNKEIFYFFISQLDLNKKEYPYKDRSEVIQEISNANLASIEEKPTVTMHKTQPEYEASQEKSPHVTSSGREKIAFFKEDQIPLSKLFSHRDRHNDEEMSLLDCAAFLGNQAMLDYAFERVSSAIPAYSYSTCFDRLNDAIDCKQSLSMIKEMYLELDVPENHFRLKLTNGSLLHTAVRRGYGDAVKFLVEKGSDVSQTYFLGFLSVCEINPTPLYTAAFHGHIEIVKYLVQQGAIDKALNASIRPLQIAVDKGHVKITQFLFNEMIDRYSKEHKNKPTFYHSGFDSWLEEDMKDVCFLREIVNGRETDFSKIRDFTNQLSKKYDGRIWALAKMDDTTLNTSDYYFYLLNRCKQMIPYLLKLLETITNQELIMKSHHNSLKEVNEKLIEAAFKGQLLLVKEWVEHDGADVNATRSDLKTPLIAAASYGHVQVVDYLITKGAKLDEMDNSPRTALMYAVWNRVCPDEKIENYFRIAKALVQNGANVSLAENRGKTPLLFAIDGNNERAVELLLTAGATVNTVDSYGETPLIYAIKHGSNIKIFELLVQHGADVRSDKTLLERASASKSGRHIVTLLILAGADRNNLFINGKTELMYAVMWDDLIRVKELIKTVDVNAKDNDGNTALIFAASKNKVNCLSILIESGADLNVQNNEERTALLLSSDKHVFRKLIDCGADVHIVSNKKRETVLTQMMNLYRSANANELKEIIEQVLAKEITKAVINMVPFGEGFFHGGKTILFQIVEKAKKGREDFELYKDSIVSLLKAGADPYIVCDGLTIFQIGGDKINDLLSTCKALYIQSDSINEKNQPREKSRSALQNMMLLKDDQHNQYEIAKTDNVQHIPIAIEEGKLRAFT